MKYNETVNSIAKEIAQNCQGAYEAHCKSACPMHTDAIGYVNLIGEGKGEEALLKIREKLFLPGSLGRICAHPCESKCKRGTEYNEPISIALLKRYATDKYDNVNLWDLSKGNPTGKKVAIIGAGPAGAQTSIELARAGHTVTIFEKLDVVGGMMYVGIPEYRLPRDIIEHEYTYLEKLGVEIKFGVEIGKDITFEKLKEEFDAVVVANGAHKGNKIPTKGDDASGITTAAEFLREISLTHKSKIIGTNKKVVVIGGGDVAMDCARSSFRVGAIEINLVSLEKEKDLPASHHELVGAKEENVILNCGFGTKEILSEGGKVTGVRLVECLSIFDNKGNFSPKYSDKTKDIDCDVVVFATGQIVEDITDGAIEQTRGGRYKKDSDTLETSIKNVFVAGDNAGSNTVIEAMALGRKCGITINRFLKGKDLKENRDFEEEGSFETKLNLPLEEGVENLPRLQGEMLDPQKRKTTFNECDSGFDDIKAIDEASRCLKCECKKCLPECIMLTEYCEYPGDLFQKFLDTGDFEPLVAYSCNMCSQCTIVCPEEFEFSKFFGAIRKDMVNANSGHSPLKGHKAIDIHQMLGFSKIFSTKNKGGK